MYFIDNIAFCLIAPTKKGLKLGIVLLKWFLAMVSCSWTKNYKKYNCWVTNNQKILVRKLYEMLYSHLTSLQITNNYI